LTELLEKNKRWTFFGTQCRSSLLIISLPEKWRKKPIELNFYFAVLKYFVWISSTSTNVCATPDKAAAYTPPRLSKTIRCKIVTLWGSVQYSFKRPMSMSISDWKARGQLSCNVDKMFVLKITMRRSEKSGNL